MIDLFLTVACLAPAPQIIPSNSEAVIVEGATVGGKLRLGALALGDGGVRSRDGSKRGSKRGIRKPRAVVSGEAWTPGGVRVRAQREGVKLDFPSGRELLVAPDGRVHLRTGEMTLPFFRGLRLMLADGAFVTVRRGASPRQPLASVEVTVAGRDRRLWSGSRRVTNASHSGAFIGTTLVVLGDGGTLFTADVAGPLIGLQRVLCPKTMRARTPPRRLLIAGNVLAESLRLLPAYAPRKSAQFPQVQEAAHKFSMLGHLFQGRTARPPGATGELWFQLRNDYRLKVESTKSGMLVIGLFGAQGSIPGVEWTIGSKTELNFVRPNGGTQGGPRYFLRGLDLHEKVDGILPRKSTLRQRAAVGRIVTALGGKRPTILDVRQR